MSSIKENIANNIIELRKEHKWTQVELGEKLNYTDKTISKWERGESTPDAESLYLMSEIFDVPIEYFFKEQTTIPVKAKHRIPNNVFSYRLSQLCLLSSTFWFIATAIYVYLMISDQLFKGSWIIFIWPVPLTFLTSSFFFLKIKFYEGLPFSFSLLLWSVISALYLQLLTQGENIWPIFIVGVPLQLMIILRVVLFKYKKDPTKK